MLVGPLPVVVVVVVIAVLGAAPLRADVPVGVQAGYAFRVVDDDAVATAHGAAAAVVVDTPALLWGFGLRAEGLALAWPGIVPASSPTAVFGAGASLTYLFDDTAVRALGSIGGIGGVVVAGSDVVAVAGATLGLLLRFPVAAGAAIDARLVVPLLSDQRFTVQAAALLGVTLLPDVIVGGVLTGTSPWSLVLPSFD